MQKDKLNIIKIFIYKNLIYKIKKKNKIYFINMFKKFIKMKFVSKNIFKIYKNKILKNKNLKQKKLKCKNKKI